MRDLNVQTAGSNYETYYKNDTGVSMVWCVQGI